MIPEASSAFRPEEDSTYLPEVWVWFAIGICVIALRCFARMRIVGWKNLRADDYLMVPFTIFWIINAVVVQITYHTGGNVDILEEEIPNLSHKDAWVLSYGSIWEFASWYTYSGTIWTLKLQVLFFYKRLNLDILRPLAVNIVSVFTCLAYVALALTISLSCRPIHLNWQISPLPGPECTFRPQNFWTLVFLNVLTDLAIMSIPTPLLFRLRISWARKAGVFTLLLSGLYMIAAAIVRAVQTLTGAPSVVNINRWGFRETGVGMLAVNGAVLVPLMTRRLSWCTLGLSGNRVTSQVARCWCVTVLATHQFWKWLVASFVDMSPFRGDPDGNTQRAATADLEQGVPVRLGEQIRQHTTESTAPESSAVSGDSSRAFIGPRSNRFSQSSFSEHLEIDLTESAAFEEEYFPRAYGARAGYG